MAALEFRVGRPMPVKQLCENLRLYLALRELVVALLVLRVVFRIRINGRHEDDVFSVRGPNAAVGSGGNAGNLTGLTIESAAFRGEVAHPDLGRVRRLGGPDEPFA